MACTGGKTGPRVWATLWGRDLRARVWRGYEWRGEGRLGKRWDGLTGPLSGGACCCALRAWLVGWRWWWRGVRHRASVCVGEWCDGRGRAERGRPRVGLADGLLLRRRGQGISSTRALARRRAACVIQRVRSERVGARSSCRALRRR